MVLSHSILDNRLLKMNIDKERSQEKDGQAAGLITTNQRLTEWHQLHEKTKKKNKCHGNRTEQQRRRRLRKHEQRQQQQLEPMDQDDPSQGEQIQVNCLLLFIESILPAVVSYNFDITHR